jgi:hypothetical protein
MTTLEKIKQLKSSTITVEDLKVIKNWLNRGEIIELAEQYKIPKQYAYWILQGRKKDPAFVDLAAERALQRQRTAMAKISTLRRNEIQVEKHSH